MSQGAEPRVGLVAGETDPSERLTDAITDAGGRLTTGAVEDVIDADPAVVIALGEAAFIQVATGDHAVPVLPVGVGRGVRSVPVEAATTAARRVVDGDWTTERHPILAVDVDGAPSGRAVLDVTVITAEAAHISEYRVATDDATLGCVRADGIVLATPAGSSGYARRIGAPVLEPGTGAVVAPVAPFATDPDHWVVDPDGVSIEQAREETLVELVVDDTSVTSLDPDETVTSRVDGHVSTAIVPESRSRYR